MKWKHFLLAVFFMMPFLALLAQQKSIRGSVVNASDNKPIDNVSVVVKGTTRGTTTNTKGEFSVSAAEGETLVFSSIGFENREVAVGTRAVLTVTLQPSSGQMQEVVVTALGIKREEKALGYSVAKVDGEELTDAMSNNWTNALTGKVAGLNLVKSGGGPAGSNKIILRGENSLLGDGNALVVVDGVVISGSSGRQTGTGSGAYLSGDSPADFGTSINDINPDDIESVSVLKGPGASALYGSRGANGAIIITTKSGKPVAKGLGITINSNATFETINRWPDYQYEYGQGAIGQDLYYSYNASEDGPSTRSTSAAWGAKFDGQMFYQYDPVTRTKGAERTPWVPYKNNRKDFFQTARTLTNSITIEGGTKATTARLSYTNLQNEWIMPNTGYKRNTVALSVNQKVSDKLVLATKVNYTNKASDNLPSTGYNNQTIMYFMSGLVPNGDIGWFRDYWVPGQEGLAQTRPFSSLLDNPYLQAYEMLNKSNRHGVIGNVSATYNFTDDLSLMVRSTMDISYESRSQQRPKGSQKFVDGMYRTQNIFSQELSTDFLVRYNRKFKNRFEGSISAGGSRMTNSYKKDELRADKLNYPGIYNFANSKNVPFAYPRLEEYAVNSLYGLATMSWNNAVFLDLTARQDWSSTLATPTSTANTGFFYPSANLSTIVSQLVDLPNVISFLKVRGGIAQVGSGSTKPYQTAYAYNSEDFTSGLSNPTSIANPNLQARITTSYELGADIRFLKNRIRLDAAVYKNDTRNQIFLVPIDRATGYSSSVQNAGMIQNKGLELELSGQVLKNKNGLNWELFGTYSTNTDLVVELSDSIQTFPIATGPRGTIEARPGGRLGALYGLGYNRAPDGQIIYNDLGYPELSTNVKYLGNTTPNWKASLGSEWSYKAFRLSMLFDGQFGGVGYSLTHSTLAEGGKLKSTLPGRYNGIIGEGVRWDEASGKFVPNDIVAESIGTYYTEHFKRDNVEANTFSTDFIKFREARLDYTVPASITKKLKLQRASVGVYGRDLFVFTNWPAFDPEFGTLNNAEINAGFEVGQFPSTRSMGINVTVGL